MLFTYTLRNLIARRRVILPTVFAIAATVGATTVMLAILEGLLGAIKESGRPNQAIVIRKGTQSEASSVITNTALGKIKTASGVVRDNDVEQVSAEFVIPLKFKQPNGQVRTINVRGVDPIAFGLHDAKVASGAMLQHSMPGVLIGDRQLGQAEGFAVGSEIWIGKHRWPIVGVLSAPGSYASELWCDRSALMAELKRDNFSSIYATLESTDAVPGFSADVAKIADQQLEALTEEVFFKRAFESVDLYIKAILAVSLFLALGAIFAGANAMYASFLGRIRELATLNAIGFTRGRVALLLLQESFALAVLSGGLGLLIAFATHGRTINYREMSIIYTIDVSPKVILAGVSVSAIIGVLGGIVAVVQAMRLNTLSALRSL